MTRTVDTLFRVLRDGADYERIYPVQNGGASQYLDESKTIRMGLKGTFRDPGRSVDF